MAPSQAAIEAEYDRDWCPKAAARFRLLTYGHLSSIFHTKILWSNLLGSGLCSGGFPP